MKTHVLCILFAMVLLLTVSSAMSQVAINTDGANPDNSAMLDVKSTGKGLLVPRMTLAQRNVISSPATGLMIYQTDNTPGFYFNSGPPALPVWNNLALEGSTWLTNGSNIYRLTGNVGIGTSTPEFKLDVSADVRINGLRIGRGAGDQSLNTALGSSSLNSNTSGSGNSAMGYRTLRYNTTGYNNSAFGHSSLTANTTGNSNTAYGTYTLEANQSGYTNTAIGSYALNENTAGYNNTCIGYFACKNNATGFNNCALGHYALTNNETGFSNVAVGPYALFYSHYRSNLIAIGDSALYFNGMDCDTDYEGSDNVAIGSKSMYYNKTGYNNTSLGFQALRLNNYGYANTAIGKEALLNNSDANYNTACGRGALTSLNTGGCNTALGAYAGFNRVDVSFGTYVGYNAYPNADGLDNTAAFGYNARPSASNQIRLGNSSVSSIGGYAGWTDFSDGRYKTNIKENVSGLVFVMKLRPVTYQLDVHRLAADLHEDENADPDGVQPGIASSILASRDKKAAIVYTGFIAQEVEQIAKSIGYDFSGVDAPKNENDFYGLRYAEFVVPLVKAVQELNQKNEALEQKIEEMRLLNAEMYSLNKELMQRIEKLEEK